MKRKKTTTPVRTVMFCLDLTEMDDFLIHYATFLGSALPDIERLIFVHNIKFDYPEAVLDIQTKADQPLGFLVRKVIGEKINAAFKNKEQLPTPEIVIQQEDSTPSCLARVSADKKADIVIAGKKISYRGAGLVVEDLLRTDAFTAALLMVPESSYHRIQDLLMPTDFSRASRRAVQWGEYLSHSTGANFEFQHVFSIPAHYFPYIPDKNVQNRLQREAEKEWNRFSKDLQPDQREKGCTFTFNRGKNTAEAIYDYAMRKQKDMIVMSTKGRGALTTLIVGSVAIRLIKKDLHIPLLIIK